jgi:hypothetical protein
MPNYVAEENEACKECEEQYKLGMTHKQALDLVIRCHNELYDLVDTLQKRIVALELQDRCNHKRCGIGECSNYPEECLRCNKKCQKRGEFYYK